MRAPNEGSGWGYISTHYKLQKHHTANRSVPKKQTHVWIVIKVSVSLLCSPRNTKDLKDCQSGSSLQIHWVCGAQRWQYRNYIQVTSMLETHYKFEKQKSKYTELITKQNTSFPSFFVFSSSSSSPNHFRTLLPKHLTHAMSNIATFSLPVTPLPSPQSIFIGTWSLGHLL